LNVEIVMSSFVCPLCLNSREFGSFSNFFRHITVFHQSDSKFHMTCDLKPSCGISYRTYAAFKSHIYRHHSNLLHSKEDPSDNIDFLPFNDHQNININSNIQLNLMDDDIKNSLFDGVSNDLDDHCDNINTNLSQTSNNGTSIHLPNSYKSSIDEENDRISILSIQKSFALFLLQLREKFSLPKHTTNLISNYMVSLINDFQSLIEQQAVIFDCNNASEASSQAMVKLEKYIVELDAVRNTKNELCYGLENVTRNEYQFLSYCKQHFHYSPPEEIVLSNHDEKLQCGYTIPIDQTLKSIFRSQETLIQVLDHMKQQQQAVHYDDDLMFSFRDGTYGSRIDDHSLLIQLYTDEIGITNPLGAKKDRHKLFMVYFALEDIPDQFRSKLDNIYLAGVCDSRILKVKALILNLAYEP
jgi:hypothetical protein